jgi:hypothetical protein
VIRRPRQRLKGLMHVSMSYKGIRKTPGAQASGVFDFGALRAARRCACWWLSMEGTYRPTPSAKNAERMGHPIIHDEGA